MSELDRSITFTAHAAEVPLRSITGISAEPRGEGLVVITVTVDGFPPEIDVPEELLSDTDGNVMAYDGEYLTITAENGTAQYKRQPQTVENQEAFIRGNVRFTRVSALFGGVLT